MSGDLCSMCHGQEARPGQRSCWDCNARATREWRRRTKMTDEQRRKDNARSYAGVYKRRGHLKPGPCSDCGAPSAEMHHEDYGRPADVTWLCRPCHLKRHGKVARKVLSRETPGRLLIETGLYTR